MSGSTQGWSNQNRSHGRERAVAWVLETLGTAAFAAFAVQKGTAGPELAASVVLFALFFIPYPALGVGLWVEKLRRRLSPAPGFRVGAAWIVTLAIFATYTALAGYPEWGRAARVAVHGLALLGAALLLPRGRPLGAPWRFALVVLVLAVPVELGWVGGLRLPAGPGGFDVAGLLVIDLALVLFLAVRPVPDLGFSLAWTRRELATAAPAFLAFAAVAIPLGLGIGFLHVGVRAFNPLEWLTLALSVYFLTAIPEEILFRGLIQNAIEKRREGKRWRMTSLGVAAVLFGLFHLDNPPAPNVPYACLATLAGVAYGAVWMRTRKVTVSALVHAAVDVVWVLFLRGGQ